MVLQLAHLAHYQVYISDAVSRMLDLQLSLFLLFCLVEESFLFTSYMHKRFGTSKLLKDWHVPQDLDHVATYVIATLHDACNLMPNASLPPCRVASLHERMTDEALMTPSVPFITA